MKFTNTRAFNFENAFRGLRNPLESWQKSDSEFGVDNLNYNYLYMNIAHLYCDRDGVYLGDERYDKLNSKYATWLKDQGILAHDQSFTYGEYAYIGPSDLALAQRMIKAGTSDRKFLRQIMVSVDITAPLYFYKEFDTYKVGTVANSTSTMHKLSSTPITKECFETDDMVDVCIEDSDDPTFIVTSQYAFMTYIEWLEELRQRYNETKDKTYWKELIRLLPESWLQTRTITLNYEVLRNIYSQRKTHRLTEWHRFCDWIKTLPYGNELITYGLD